MSVTIFAQTNTAGSRETFELPGADTGWRLRYEDEYLTGNFDPDGRVYAVVVNPDRQRIAILEQSDGSLIAAWQASPAIDSLQSTASNWQIDVGDRFYVGDFDGDGLDEILAVSEVHNRLGLIEYTADSGLRVSGIASEIPASGEAQPLSIASGQRYAVGDYDGDGQAEVCVFDAEQGTATIFKWIKSSFRVVASAEGSTTGLPWALHQDNKAYVGAFRSGDHDELLVKDESGTSLGLIVWDQNTLKTEHIVSNLIPFSETEPGGWPLQLGDSITIGKFTDSERTEALISSWDGQWIGLIRWQNEGLITIWMVNELIRSPVHFMPGKDNKIVIPRDEQAPVPGLPLMSPSEFRSRFKIPELVKPLPKRIETGSVGKIPKILEDLGKWSNLPKPSLPKVPSLPGMTFPFKDGFVVIDAPPDLDFGTPVWKEWRLLVGDRFFAADYTANGRDQILTTRALGDEIAIFEVSEDGPLLLDSKTNCVPEAGQQRSCGWTLERYDRVYVGFGTDSGSEFIMASSDGERVGVFAAIPTTLPATVGFPASSVLSLLWSRRDWISDASSAKAIGLTIDLHTLYSSLGGGRSVSIDPSPDPAKTRAIVTFLAYPVVREGWHCGETLSSRKYATRIFDVSGGRLDIDDILEATGGWLPRDLEVLYVASTAELARSQELAQRFEEIAESFTDDVHGSVQNVIVSKFALKKLGVEICLLVDVPLWPANYGARITYNVDIISGNNGPIAEATMSVSVEPGLFSDEIKNNIEVLLNEAASREEDPIDTVETVESQIEQVLGSVSAPSNPLIIYGNPVSNRWTRDFDRNTGTIIPG